MIGRLRGVLIEKKPPGLLIDVGGVGYELEAPMSTFYQLPELQQPVTLFTHLTVREDAHLLFGFVTEGERRLFRTLLKVNGVGSRLALTILSGSSVDEFAQCINAGDVQRLIRLPGVGKKTAERLIVEMRDRLADWTSGLTEIALSVPLHTPEADPVADALSGMIALGYKPQEASRFVHAVTTAGLSSERIIREALKLAVKA